MSSLLAIDNKTGDLLAGARMDGEPNSAVFLCNDYLRMGPRRTLELVWQQYNALHPDAPINHGSLASYSSRFKWSTRALEYDRLWDEAKTMQVKIEQDEVLGRGISMTHERLKRLMAIEQYLFDQFSEEGADGSRPNIWIEEFRQMGGQIITNRTYNKGLIQSLLDIYEDAALETGGRRVKLDATAAVITVTAEDLMGLQTDVGNYINTRFNKLPVSEQEDE